MQPTTKAWVFDGSGSMSIDRRRWRKVIDNHLREPNEIAVFLALVLYSDPKTEYWTGPLYEIASLAYLNPRRTEAVLAALVDRGLLVRMQPFGRGRHGTYWVKGRALVTKTPTNRSAGGSVVYAVQAGGMVKIGTTTSTGLNRRLSAIQTGCPFGIDLIGVAPGDRALERTIHEHFAHRRDRGEWFILDETDREELMVLLLGQTRRLLT